MGRLQSAISAGRDDSHRGWLAEVFTLDVRSLAVMRMGIGLVLLVNLYGLAADAAAFYSDAGILSRISRLGLNVEEQFTAPPYGVSLNMLCGEAWFQYLLCGLAAVFGLGVLVGYRTGWALLGSWLLLSGLQARNPLVLDGGDDVLRCLLLWSIFLPLGAVWSLDCRRTNAPPPTHVYSIASAALLIQLGCIYFFTAILKSHPNWRSDFSALYYALATEHLTTPFGLELLRFPTLLQVLTAATLGLEFVGPLLLLCAWRTACLRTALVAAFCCFHLGIAATFYIGLFPLTCIVYWCAVLPTGFWDRIEAAGGRLCPLLAAARPRDGAGGILAPTSFVIQSLVASLLFGVLLLNFARLTNSVYVTLQPGPLRMLTEAAQLNQFWCMFSPRPADFGGWFNINGTLEDGRQVNLLNPDLPPQETRPQQVSALYPSARWSKLLMTLFERECPTYRRGVGEYLCRRWNANHGPDEQLVTAEIRLILEPTRLPGEPLAKIRPASGLVLWQGLAPRQVPQSGH